MSPPAPPIPPVEIEDTPLDLVVRIFRAVGIVAGLVPFGYVFLICVLLATGNGSGDDDSLVWAEATTIVALASVGSVVHFVASSGLADRRVWAWWLALLLGFAYFLGCCFPFGLLVLVALLRRHVREAFR